MHSAILFAETFSAPMAIILLFCPPVSICLVGKHPSHRASYSRIKLHVLCTGIPDARPATIVFTCIPNPYSYAHTPSSSIPSHPIQAQHHDCPAAPQNLLSTMHPLCDHFTATPYSNPDASPHSPSHTSSPPRPLPEIHHSTLSSNSANPYPTLPPSRRATSSHIHDRSDLNMASDSGSAFSNDIDSTKDEGIAI